MTKYTNKATAKTAAIVTKASRAGRPKSYDAVIMTELAKNQWLRKPKEME